jgi:two-component system nitrogen regulation response regulator GlnG
VIRVHIPPLRERREDIPLLLSFFLDRAARELGIETKILRPNVEAYLCRMEWPGNVRQLENTCRWLTVMASGREIHMEDLPPELRRQDRAADANLAEQGWEDALRKWAERRLIGGEHGLLLEATPSFERIMIETALRHTGGRRQEAARLLGWGRNTLTRKIKELNLPAET